MLGIGDYDAINASSQGLASLKGMKKDYANMIFTFNHFYGYSMFYRITPNKNEYSNKVGNRNQFKKKFKIKWNCNEIFTFINDCKNIILNKKHDSLIFIISCHGETNNCILDSNGDSCELVELFNKFDAKNCSYLADKPKLFFVDSCRGQKKSNAFAIQSIPKSAINNDSNNNNPSINTTSPNTTTKTDDTNHSSKEEKDKSGTKVVAYEMAGSGNDKTGVIATRGAIQPAFVRRQMHAPSSLPSIPSNVGAVSNLFNSNYYDSKESEMTLSMNNAVSVVSSDQSESKTQTSSLTTDEKNDNEKNSNNNNQNKNAMRHEMSEAAHFVHKLVSQSELYHKDANFRYIYGNPEGYQVYDGGKKGGYLIQAIKKVFCKPEILTNNVNLDDIISQIRMKTRDLAIEGMGRNANDSNGNDNLIGAGRRVIENVQDVNNCNLDITFDKAQKHMNEMQLKESQAAFDS